MSWKMVLPTNSRAFCPHAHSQVPGLQVWATMQTGGSKIGQDQQRLWQYPQRCPNPITQALLTFPGSPTTAPALRGPHVVLWLQGDFQDLGVAHNFLIAGGGNGFACDPVYLVEGVRLKDSLIGCPNEDLKSQGLVLHVAMELRKEKKKTIINFFQGGGQVRLL